MPTEQEEIVDFINSLPKVESGQNKGMRSAQSKSHWYVLIGRTY